jgi:molybdopterin biosynthesis enzyme
VKPLTGQGSHQVATLGKANALIVVPEWVVQMAAGDTADVLVLPLAGSGTTDRSEENNVTS